MSAGLKIGLAWFGCLAIGGFAGWHASTPRPTLTFLAVGQGDCAVFRDHGATVLIDVGPRNKVIDAGERIVVPDLRRMGVANVDLILLSHPDKDHVGGLKAVLTAYPGATVAISAYFRSHAGMLDVLRDAGLDASQVLWLPPWSHARIDGFDLELRCPNWREPENDNKGSMFVRLSDGHSSAVLTGDADSETEHQMLPENNWRSQVLKVGHHGSYTATSDEWLAHVHPQWGVVSCGRNNIYGHPHSVVLGRLKRAGVGVLRTDTDGDVEFHATGRGFELGH